MLNLRTFLFVFILFIFSAVGVSAQTVVNGGYTFQGPLTANDLDAGNVANKVFSTDTTRYISASGSDSNDGLSWGTAKLTVSGACSALPSGNSTCTSGSGTIIAAPGITGIFLPVGASPSVTLSWGEYSGGSAGANTGGTVTSGPVPWIDVRAFGARSFNSSLINTITVSSPGSSATVTTTGIADFIPGDGIAIPQAGASTAQSTPSAPTVNSIGATGSSTINYKCVGVDQYWGLTAASAAGTTTTAPTVFGNGAVLLSSISRSSNTVSFTTAANMPFSSGNYHVTISDVTGGTTNFSGLFYVTITSATTGTYSQTGANESGTVVTNTSYVLFENAFVVTSVQATAGSNTLVLTTDVNHNIVEQQDNALPTIAYLDGIQFSGMPVQGYANGPFPIVSVTSNTITVRTPWVATATTTGSASTTFSNARGALQMTVTVWAEQEVVCPVLAGTTRYYAVYADYGSGYAPIGFTTWHHNIFLDYGSAFTKTGFVPPQGMDLPVTPPVSAQNQIFSGQVQSISGSTLTLTTNVPTAVTSVTAYHDNVVPFLNALNYSCQSTINSGNNNTTFFPVYFAPTAGATYYYFNAPVNMSNTPNSCNRTKILLGGALFLNGTWTADNQVYISKPADVAGTNVSVSGGNTGLGIYVLGHASPLMGGSTNGSLWQVNGLVMQIQSNGQNGFVNTGNDSKFENFACVPSSSALLSSTCFVNSGTQEATVIQNFNFGGIPNIATPLSPSPGNTGQVMWWPVPAVLSQASQYSATESNIILEGENYGNGTGFEWSNLYSVTSPSLDLEFQNVQTFQEPWQPFLTFRGGGTQPYVLIKNVIMDSIQQPVLSTIVGGGGNSDISVLTFYGSGGAVAGAPTMTGNPQARVHDISVSGGMSQNVNDNYQSPNGWQESGPEKAYCNPTTGNTTNAFSLINSVNTTAAAFGCPNGQLLMLEAAAPSGVSSQDILYGDSTAHAFKIIQNNTTAQQLAGFTSTPTNGDCANISVVAGVVSLGDAGGSCTTSGGGLNTSMSNMANPTALSQTLTPGAANSIALGTQLLPFTNGFFGTVANQSGSFNTANLTANRVINWPDATSTTVRACASVSNQFLTAIAVATGVCSQAQPTLANIAAGASPSGLFDFSGSTMKIPQAAGFTASSSSTIGLDTTAHSVHLYVNSADSIASAFASAPAGSLCVQTSGTTGLLVEASGVCGTVTPSSTNTLTNKTYNAESTGNALGEPVHAFFPAGGCNNSVAGNGWDIGVTNAPLPQCAGTTVRKGTLAFAQGNVGYLNFHLPSDWNSSASTDIEICFTTTDTTNGHVTSFNIQTGFNAVNGTVTDDPTLNALQALSVTTGASQVSGGELCGKLTSMTMTGSAADYNFEIAVTRNNSGTDTNTDTAVAVKSAELIYGVTKNAANR